MDKTIPEPNSGCWLWFGSTYNDGYGECWAFGKRERASHASYREFVCEIPEGKIIRHKCDNKHCVNPDHLIPGTQQENIQDKVERNRQAKGEVHGCSKLTEDQAIQIRRSKLSTYKLADLFGISQAQAAKIKSGKAWTYLSEIP